MKPESKAPSAAQVNVSRIVRGLLGFRHQEQRTLAPVLDLTTSGVSAVAAVCCAVFWSQAGPAPPPDDGDPDVTPT